MCFCTHSEHSAPNMTTEDRVMIVDDDVDRGNVWRCIKYDDILYECTSQECELLILKGKCLNTQTTHK